MYKEKVAVYSDISTKHSTQSERHVEFLKVKPWWYGKKLLGFKRLNYVPNSINLSKCRLLCESIAVFILYIDLKMDSRIVFGTTSLRG
jgi:hypothetical protein